MAVTRTAPAEALAPPSPGERRWGPLGHPAVLLAAAALLLVAFGWSFLRDPTLVAPTRDPAWYTWRTQLLLEDEPAKLIREWGPFGMFSGGYRVATPVAGALLMRVAGVDGFTFSILLMVGTPVLASLALAAFAYRHRRDPLLFLLTLLASGALFLTTPFVGYIDNVMALFLVAVSLPFLGPARTSWAARSAVALFLFLATLAHPTTVAMFVLVLGAAAGLRFLASRLSVGKTLDADGPMVASAALGAIVGLAVWKVGIWGLEGPLSASALPPPYSSGFFVDRLVQWVGSLQLVVTVPLLAAALGSIAVMATRRREGMDEYARISLLWLLPLIGLFGFVLGLTYPYYRFMNTTLALMLLAGMGAWVLARLSLRARPRAVGAAGVALLLVGLGWVLARGLLSPGWSGDRWLDRDSRAALAAVRAYADREPAGRPILFVTDFRDDRTAWGRSKTYANTARAGLSGDDVDRSLVYFGSVEQLFAGEPTKRSHPIYNRVSRGFWEETSRGLARFGQPPVVFLVRQFNAGTENAELMDSFTRLGPDVAIVTGPGLAEPSPEAVAAAREAGEREAARLADPPGLLDDPLHLLRVLGGLAILLVVPGLIAARWFELRDGAGRLALVPALSFGLVILSGVVVVAVRRAPFGVADAWAAAALAIGIAGVLHFLARRRDAGRGRVGPAINRFVTQAFSLFADRNFSFLMAAQFLAVAGDGIVQGSLAKAIAFGGREGFSLENAPSARYLLGLVLLLYLPYTFVSPLVGVLIDRFDRRTLLVVSNGLRAGVVGLVALWGLVGDFDAIPDVVLIAVLVLSLASTRMLLAIKSAGLPAVLGERDLLQGNAISQAGSALFQILGAGVAVVGTAVLPVAIPVLAGAAVYGAGSVVASRIERLEWELRKVPILRELRRMFRDVWEGLVEVRRRSAAALGLLSFQALRMELASFVGLVFALQARAILGGETDRTAVIVAGATAALGAGLGFVTAHRLKDRIPPARLLVAAMVASGVGVIAFGGVTTLVGFSALAFVAAFGFFVGKISADTIMQGALPDHFRGRGFSLFDVAYNVGWIVPALILFAVYSESRARVILIASGVVFLALTGVVAAWARRISPELQPAERTGEAVTLP